MTNYSQHILPLQNAGNPLFFPPNCTGGGSSSPTDLSWEIVKQVSPKPSTRFWSHLFFTKDRTSKELSSILSSAKRGRASDLPHTDLL